ncbi:MAG: type II secretion system F family protein [Jatrophihabitans sp.]|uniref:type II secretion system F family protein n=1 Tax=Jatrophihabitans sp. TaxID=1932789 RepID=UPI003F7FE8D3
MLLLVVGLVSAALCVLVLVLGAFGVFDPAPSEASLETIETFYGHNRAAPAAVRFGAEPLPPAMQRLRAIVVRISPAAVVTNIGQRLDQAGNPGKWTVERVLAFKGLSLFALGGLFFVLGIDSGPKALFWALVGAFLGFALPDYVLAKRADARQQRIRKGLPDAIDMLTVCVEAGLGFDAALAQVARNLQGPMAEECGRVLQEMQFGKSRVEALRALVERTTVRELRMFISAIVQASGLGISVAAVLREQSREMRLTSRQLAEEVAQKIPVKILFPVVFCLLPAMFVIILGPGIMGLGKVF